MRQQRRKCPGRTGRHQRMRRRGTEGKSSHSNERPFVRASVGGRRETEGCLAPRPECHHQTHHPHPSLVLSLCSPLSRPPALHQR